MRLASVTRLHPGRHHANVQFIVLALVCFLLGIGVSLFWFHHSKPRSAAETPGASPLSESTKAVLSRLQSPVEIRFYSVLDTASLPAAVPAFAGRVEQLLAAYQEAANGQLKVTRIDAHTPKAPDAAVADGIKTFNLDKGDACFLGLTLALDGNKESLPQLAPEWESALESDLTRALDRLLTAQAAAKAAAAPAPLSPAVTEQVKSTITNFASVSVQEGAQVLRESALKEFMAATKEMEAQLKQAQERVTQAKSEEEQQAARKNLLQVQAEQTAKLQEIAARSSAQMDALQQLKAEAK